MNSYKLEIPRNQFDRIADAFESTVIDVNGYDAYKDTVIFTVSENQRKKFEKYAVQKIIKWKGGSKKNPYNFDRFMDKLYDAGVAKITIVEDIIDSDWTQEEIVDLAQDTVTLINNEIDKIEEVQDKPRMKKLIKDLYMESLSV